MAYGFGIDHSDQTLHHVPEFKKELDGCVAHAKSVVYIGWRPGDSEYKFFHWLMSLNTNGPPTTLLVDAWKPNVDAFVPPYIGCFKTCGRAEFLLDIVPEWMRDCVVWQDGPEHLSIGEGMRAIKCMKRGGFKSIIISTPDGYLEQGPLDGNPYEKHECGWNRKQYAWTGFKVESYSAGLIGYWKRD